MQGSYGAQNGYWTSSKNTANTSEAWAIMGTGGIFSKTVLSTSSIGIRPVISVERSLLN